MEIYNITINIFIKHYLRTQKKKFLTFGPLWYSYGIGWVIFMAYLTEFRII